MTPILTTRGPHKITIEELWVVPKRDSRRHGRVYSDVRPPALPARQPVGV